MRKYYSCFVIILMICISGYAQIAITEVYYDTPFIERVNRDSNAHLGEYIEIFNYSTESIDISRWKLSDNDGSFYFPDGTVIASNDYLIIARKVPYANNYFFDLFPNEQNGNENKVLYQNRLTMNNYRDWVTLSTKRLAGQNLKRYYTISKVKWKCGSGIPCDRNPIDPDTFGNQNSQGFYNTNFNYYVPSLQKFQNADLSDIDQNLSYYAFTATPFGLTFTPELTDIEDIENVNDILEANYESLSVDEVIEYYINMNCDISIPIIASGNVSGTYIEDQCFMYDASGNREDNQLCPSDDENSDSSTNSNSDQDTDSDTEDSIEEIANKIYIAPNPTSGLITISWEAEIASQIGQIAISPMTGSALEIPVNISSNSYTATSDLSSYSNGFYVVRFTLSSNEVITKTVIKN